jgi:hypothetical protein
VDRHGHIGAIRVTAQTVVLVLKRQAVRPRLDPERVAGRSLRAGLLTSTASAGVPERVIAAQTDSRDTAILHRNIREGLLFRENAAGAVGL